jgi:hypothetical protein
MTDERQGDDDYSNPTFDSDAERAEHEWLIAREANPDAVPPSPEVAQCYAHLESLLSSLPAPADDAHWQEALLKRAAERGDSPSPARRPWRRRPEVYATAGAIFAVAAILLIFLYPRKPTIDPDAAIALAYTITHSGTQRADPKDAAIHDSFESRLPRGDNDLRIYRPDGSLAARCPEGPGCTTTAGGSQLHVQLDLPGRYSVFLVVGTTKIPIDGTKSEFLERVRVVQARMEPPRVFDVE